MINVKTFLPLISVFIPQINTYEMNIVLKQLKCYTKINGYSDSTKFGVRLHLYLIYVF